MCKTAVLSNPNASSPPLLALPDSQHGQQTHENGNGKSSHDQYGHPACVDAICAKQAVPFSHRCLGVGGRYGGSVRRCQSTSRLTLPWPSCSTASSAAFHGAVTSCVNTLRILQCARDYHCPWNRRTCRLPAEGGHLEVLKWAHDNGCVWDEETCTAAQRVHPGVFQWARLNGCPWDGSTCAYAAKRGDLEMLQ